MGNIGINFYLCGKIDQMQQPSAVSRIQLARFRTKDPDMSIDQSVYICDGYILPSDIPLPFRLSFTASVICVEGEMGMTVNQRELSLSRGDVIIVQNGSIIERLRFSPHLSTIATAYPATEDEWLFSREAEKLGKWLDHRSIPLVMHFSEVQLQRYLDLFHLVKTLYHEAAVELRDEMVRGFLSVSVASFLSQTQMSINVPASLAASRGDEVFLRFMDDLQLYAGRERTVQFYADRQFISAKHFSKLVRQVSGKHPMEHIRNRVIIEAKTLLRSTDLSIREIADALHFSNDSFFCRYFKHDTGLSPFEYRKS